jgi:aquaporin Z
MAKYPAEFLGTFVLVFVIILTTVAPGASAAAPFAIGLGLAIMIYALGHVSGAHFNPAVSLALHFRNEGKMSDFLYYVASQVAGGLAGAYIALIIKSDAIINTASFQFTPALLAEFIFTFILAFVVLNVATAKKNEGNSFYGLAIGGTVTTGALSVGSISGAVFNPAVTMALFFTGIMPQELFVSYIAVQLFAGIVAAGLFKALAIK